MPFSCTIAGGTRGNCNRFVTGKLFCNTVVNDPFCRLIIMDETRIKLVTVFFLSVTSISFKRSAM